ncbi:ABC transporter ATP-binding protein [Paenibacillus popilliae]|uniref:ABC transporter ATP-binding protein n=2 Tax=Paenibacillus popilliae TaxID=78057 RepID=A0ABY3AJA1_PAEPP|nr:ABC transporter ATP-binding protein [Paenibacillus sp. SDF0028]
MIALAMLILSVISELTGPFIAKIIIDNHILGIEKPWNEVQTYSEKAVLYQDHWYKRSDNFKSDEIKGKEVRILQVGRKYVFIPESIRFDGERIFEDDKLIITNGDMQNTYPAQQITSKELLQFYKPQVYSIIALIIFYLSLMLIASIFEYGRVYFLQSSANRIVQKMRIDVYNQIHRLPIKYFDNTPAGSMVSRVTNDTEAVKELFINVVSNFVSGAVYLISVFIALFILNVKLALICIIIIPILIVWIVLYRKLATKYNHLIRARLSDINSFVNEIILGIPIIRAFSRQKDTKTKFGEINDDYCKYQKKMLSLDALTSYSLANVLKSLSLAMVIWFFGGAALSVESAISFGVLYAFIDYIGRMFQPVVSMVNQLAQLEQSLVAAERVFELIELPGANVINGNFLRYKGNIQFKNVWFAYKNEEYVLKNISFEVNQGETIALVGHTGAGKSSVINTLLRFYDIQKGTIEIDGDNIQDISPQHVRQHIGIVLQDTLLFPGTIASNISLNNPSISRENILKALLDVGGADMLNSLPKGIDEPVIEKGSTLSLGQRQLIAFARALVYDPAILILDEATSNIDTETEVIIQRALDLVKKQRTTIIIAHRLSTIRNADQILVLNHGEIVERGDHEELIKLHGKYYQMNQLQNGITVTSQ